MQALHVSRRDKITKITFNADTMEAGNLPVSAFVNVSSSAKDTIKIASNECRREMHCIHWRAIHINLQQLYSGQYLRDIDKCLSSWLIPYCMHNLYQIGFAINFSD